ncbi:hypothetical protein Tco_0854462 [Tanacetum coccineum]
MENANSPPNNRPVLTAALHARAVQELHDLQIILAFVDSRLESIKQFLNNFANQRNETDMNNLESDDESLDTPLVSPFPYLDNDLDDGEVLNELIKYENVGMLRRERAINSFDGDDLAFQCMIGFRKFVAYFDPFLPMNIITRKAYNTIMVEGLESTGKNLVSVVRDVYVFVGNFTYITDFMVIFDEKNLGQHGDGVAGIKRRRRDLSSDGVRNLASALGRGRLKEDLQSSTWRRRQDFKAMPS